VSARSALCIALGAVLTLQIQAQEQRSFVACPIYRDTDQGRKSGCWLADDPATGTRYDVGEWLTKPQEGYEVLVEGIISSEPDVCGGIVLRPVRTAVLHDQHCPLTEFEAEGFSGRRYALPRDVMQQSWVPRPAPQPPFSTQHYLLLFDFADDRLIYQYSETILERAALYSRTSHGRITIRAYAATRPLKISGQALTEPLALARARAEMVNEALLRLGVDRSALHMEWHGEPEPLNPLPAVGAPLPESSLRRVEITVEPQSTL
jgi:outer membrane protein OmpA-like peptidoglycan-associated protein